MSSIYLKGVIPMANEYILSCSSTADLTLEHFKRRDIHFICFHYQLDGVDYPDDLGQTIPFDKFYQAMVDGADTRTSQINMEEYVEYFEQFLQDGKDVLHLTLSSGISGTYNSARMAQEKLAKKYPERKLIVLDSLAAASGYGLLMDGLADVRDSGATIDEAAKWVEDNKLRVAHWLFSSDLTFFIKGGRVSKTSGMIGQLLNICPMLNVSNEGKLVVREKIRTKRKAMASLVKRMTELADGNGDYNGKCFICHSARPDDASNLASMVQTAFPKLNGKPEVFSIGTTIGSHTGPGTLALFFWGQERVD